MDIDQPLAGAKYILILHWKFGRAVALSLWPAYAEGAVLPPCRVPLRGSPASVSALENKFTTQSLPRPRRTAWFRCREGLSSFHVKRMEDALSYWLSL